MEWQTRARNRSVGGGEADQSDEGGEWREASRYRGLTRRIDRYSWGGRCNGEEEEQKAVLASEIDCLFRAIYRIDRSLLGRGMADSLPTLPLDSRGSWS